MQRSDRERYRRRGCQSLPPRGQARLSPPGATARGARRTGRRRKEPARHRARSEGQDSLRPAPAGTAYRTAAGQVAWRGPGRRARRESASLPRRAGGCDARNPRNRPASGQPSAATETSSSAIQPPRSGHGGRVAPPESWRPASRASRAMSFPNRERRHARPKAKGRRGGRFPAPDRRWSGREAPEDRTVAVQLRLRRPACPPTRPR